MTGRRGKAFPFSAVVGQDEARLALVLAAIDPGIGGVLLRGDKGSAKTTLARGLASLLPAGAPFVELPIGATEDRVAGGLDLTQAFAGEARLRSGLVAAADGGVLYVDEVNLLPDHLVDLLLDAAASGTHRVERDGMSERAPARFVLVGSMNPEEGELRPQLLDRFGLSVEVRTPADPEVRARAVRARLLFDADAHPDTDAASTAADQADAALARRLAASEPARLADEVVAFACRLALAAGVEGLRGDLMLCRAAAALAGWEGRADATEDDVARVAGMALAHRRRRRPFEPPTFPPADLAQALADARRPPSEAGGDAEPPPASGESAPSPPDGAGDPGGPAGDSPSDSGGGGPSHSGSGGPSASSGPSSSEATAARWGDLAPEGAVPVPSHPAPVDRGVTTGADVQGHLVGERRPAGAPVAVAPAATVRASLRRRAADPASAAAVVVDDLREPVRRRASRQCTILVVDASSSMGVADRVEAASGAVLGLLTDAYRRRHRVALIACRGTKAEVVLPPTASVELARARLVDLPTGGATPLAEGLEAALQVAHAARREDDLPLVVVITDGRATAGPDPLARALRGAEELARAEVATLVLDAEDGPRRLGLAAEVAAAACGRCVPLRAMTAGAVEAAIRATPDVAGPGGALA